MKVQLIALLCYAVIFAPGCRQRQDVSQSKFNFDTTSYDDAKVDEFKSDTKGLMRSVSSSLGESLFSSATPVVVLDHATLDRRYPSQEEILDSTRLKSSEKIYIGDLESRYVIGMSVPQLLKGKWDGEAPISIVFSQYDTESNSKGAQGFQFRRVDGFPLSISKDESEEVIRNKITKNMQSMKSFTNKALNMESKQEYNDVNNRIDGLSRKKLGGNIYIAAAFIICLLGMMAILTAEKYFTRIVLDNKVVPIILLAGVVLIAFTWYLMTRYNRSQQNKIDALEELKNKYLRDYAGLTPSES